MGLACSLRAALAASALVLSSLGALSEPIRGAGSTFAAPVIARWARLYQTVRADGGDFISPDWTVDYELVGSLAGIMRLDQPELDFAATDAPLPPEDLAKRGASQFPIVIGGVAIVANVEGVATGRLRLTGEILADIYLGKIQNWSDAAIKALNPDLSLPDQRINVLHRKDGSGTTATFTEYLSAVSPEWKQKYGADTLISWPLGTAAEGSQGLVRSATATKGSIAYIEFGQVSRANLPVALVRNRAGQFVRPEPAAFQAAASAVDWSGARDFFRSLTDQPGEAAYPISAVTFAIVPHATRGRGRVARVHDLFRVAFDEGAAEASALGYVPLPPPLVEQIKAYWTKGRAGG